MESLGKLNWMDLLVVLILIGGVLAGWTQGVIRYLLGILAVLVTFIVASQLKHPVTVALSAFWDAFTPQLRELWVYIALYVLILVGLMGVIHAFYHRTRLPVSRALDEIGGALLGLAFAAMVVTFGLIVLDTFFKAPAAASEVGGAGVLKAVYDALSGSLLVDVFRQTIIPTFAVFVRPFVPAEIAAFVRR